MGEPARYPIVLNQTFIEATRDTGYRSTAAAVAELVDNAIQASAKKIHIFVREDATDTKYTGISVAVLDDGTGMENPVLRRALQFGGSARFGAREGLGRFGMGLPNASVSQARRVDVYTWRAPNACYLSHLDVDDIAEGRLDEIPVVRKGTLPKWAQEHRGFSGTLVAWTRCDRLDNRKVSTVARKLHEPLGRMFRHFIWGGTKIFVNDEPVVGIDPLFLNEKAPLSGATTFGDPLTFEVRVPGKPDKTSVVTVRFSELPVAKWHDMHVDDKRKHGIIDRAGLSILRANREVDYGWWFFGAKRRENYDSWWRGELSFDPELDELFAITHSKQGINPTTELREVLTSDLEAVARQLNGRVQDAFAKVKAAAPPSPEPPAPMLAPTAKAEPSKAAVKSSSKPVPRVAKQEKSEPEYTVAVEKLGKGKIFEGRQSDGNWTLVINRDHPFYSEVYDTLRGPAGEIAREHLERVLLAYAKTEWVNPKKRIDPRILRSGWAGELARLLEGE